MNKNNKLSSIKTSKDSLDTVQLPFPIPSSRLKDSLSQRFKVTKPLPREGTLLGQANSKGLKAFSFQTQDFSLLEKKEVVKTLPFFNRSFDKKRLKLLFSWYYANKGENAAFTLVETLQKLGFAYAMKAGISLGVDDLKVPSTKIESLTEAVEFLKNTKASVESGNVTALEEFQQFVDTWHRTSENLKTSVIQNFTRGLSKKTSLPKTFKEAKIKKPKINGGWAKNSCFVSQKNTLSPLNQNHFVIGDKVQGKPVMCAESSLEKAQKSKAFFTNHKNPFMSSTKRLDQRVRPKGKTQGKGLDTEQIFSEKASMANSTTWDESPSIESLRVADSQVQEQKSFETPGTLDTVTLQSQPLLRSYGNTLNPVYMMAFSGARGNLSQVRQLVGMRGLMADPQGQLVEFPIQSNFREGLTVTEYMISCYGARKGLVDTALRTAAAGYLTRRLVDVSHHQIVSSVTCGTKSGIRLPLHTKKQSLDQSIKSNITKKTKDGKSLTFCIGRVLARDIPGVAFRNQEIDISLGSSHHFREVYEKVGISIRSPLTCKSEIGICQLCYGWSVSANRLVGLGEAVGIIAAQSIGEPGTQLTMRTFHTGGVFSGDIMEECRAKHEGFVSFQGTYLGLMVRTAGGAIAFCLKTTGIMHIKGLEKLTTYTLLPNTLLFVRQGERVEVETLLAQIPNLPEIEESTGESTKTIVSYLSGEVRQTPTVNKELENIRILAGQEDISIFCSSMLPLDLRDVSSKYNIPDQLVPLRQGFKQVEPFLSSIRTPQKSFFTLKKENGISPFLHSIPRFVSQKSQDNQKSFFSELNLDRLGQKNSNKQKVHLIKGSHRIGNHTRTYKKIDRLTEDYQFINKSQIPINLMGQNQRFLRQQANSLILDRSLKNQRGKALKSGGSIGFRPIFDKAQDQGVTNNYFLSKITKLLTQNNLKIGVLEQLRSLQVLKKQKYTGLISIRDFLETGPLEKSQTSTKQVWPGSLRVQKSQTFRTTEVENSLSPLLRKAFIATHPKSVGASSFDQRPISLGILLTHALENLRTKALIKQKPLIDQKDLGVLFIINILPKLKLNKIKVLQKTVIDLVTPRSLWLTQVVGPRLLESSLITKKSKPLLFGLTSTTNQKGKLKALDFMTVFKMSLKVPLDPSVLGSSPVNLQHSFKTNTLFLYRAFFFHPYNPPLLLYKLKNPMNFAGHKALRQGVVQRALVRKEAMTFQKKLQVFHPFLGQLLQSFHSNLFHKEKKSFVKLQECSYFLWWPLKMQGSSFEKQKVKFYTLKGNLKTISLSKPLNLLNYSYLFWKCSYLLFVKSLRLKKQKPSFLKKRILKNVQWWGFTHHSSLVALLNKNKSNPNFESVPVGLLSRQSTGSLSDRPSLFGLKAKGSCRGKLVEVYPAVKPWPVDVFLLQKSRSNKKVLVSLKGLPQSTGPRDLSFKSFSSETSFGTALPLLLRTPIATNFLGQKEGLDFNRGPYSELTFLKPLALTSAISIRSEKKQAKGQTKDLKKLKTSTRTGSNQTLLAFSPNDSNEQSKEISKGPGSQIFFGQKSVYKNSLNIWNSGIEELDSFVASQKSGELFPIQGNTSRKNFETFYTSWRQPQKKNKEKLRFNGFKSGFYGTRAFIKSFDQGKDLQSDPLTNKNVNIPTNSGATYVDKNSHGVKPVNMLLNPDTKAFGLYFSEGLQNNSKGLDGRHDVCQDQRLDQCLTKENLILTHSDRISYNLMNEQSLGILNHSEKNYKENSKNQKDLLLAPRFYQAQSLLDIPLKNAIQGQTKFLKPKIGYYINSGDELIKNFGSTHCGQIIEKSYYQLTLRLTQNVLYSNLRNRPAVVSQNVQDGRWVCKGTSLVTLPYISSVTGDIVAGIPKIEQLFEARGEALEKTVDKIWLSYKTAVVPRAKAVRECFKEIGLFVVAAIQKVYSSQGVKIADKHLEVIIRQMIGRALIVDPGDTPFLPDEFVDLQTIERVNWTTYGERATYRPRLVGITKASLTTNSFLSSASFQQTARVLERETFLEKTDRLLGLKERVMMGALINAGTGDFKTGVVLSKVSQTFVRKN